MDEGPEMLNVLQFIMKKNCCPNATELVLYVRTYIYRFPRHNIKSKWETEEWYVHNATYANKTKG